jgi:tetratricopeptide (TPR) repeat protein
VEGKKALVFFNKAEYGYRISICASNLAEAHFELGELDEAKKYAQTSLEQEEPQSIPYALFVLGHVAEAYEDYPQAEAHYQQGIAIAENNNDTFVAAYLYRDLGALYSTMGKKDAICPALRQAEHLFTRLQIGSKVQTTRDLIMTLCANT